MIDTYTQAPGILEIEGVSGEEWQAWLDDPPIRRVCVALRFIVEKHEAVSIIFVDTALFPDYATATELPFFVKELFQCEVVEFLEKKATAKA